MEQIEAFFVDIGGVLLDHSRDKSRFHEKVVAASKASPEAVESIYQMGVRRHWFSLETGVISPYKYYQHYVGMVHSIIPIEMWGQFREIFTYAYFREAFGNVFIPKPKVVDFIFGLRARGKKIILVSNNNPIHYDYCVRTSSQIITRVDDCILSHEVGYRKPDPEIWKIALDVASCYLKKFVPADKVFCIDDKPENVASFKALGGNGATFTSVEALKESLRPFGFEFTRTKLKK